jgi:hypothetical protein
MRNDERIGLMTQSSGLSDEAKIQVKKTLEEMVSSGPFRTSRQCQDLLRYVVLHSLNGEDESLRERIIGVEVFGRRPDYDQAADPVVRIRAADVRKRIALYYGDTKEAARHLKIGIPSGSYRAFFEFFGSRDEEERASDRHFTDVVIPPSAESGQPINPLLETIIPDETRESGRVSIARRRLPIYSLSALLLIFTIYGLLQLKRETPFERFWSPFLKSSNPSLIYVGSNAVYSLSQAFVDKYRQEHHLDKVESMGREIMVPLGPNDILTGNDLTPARDTYVTIGDVATTAKIASLLTLRKKEYDMRFGGDISVGDLRERPAILVGGFNNSWTLEMTDSLRFIFAYGHEIQDRFDPKRTWKANQGFTEDYAIISRILNSKTGEILITAAGIGHAGTRAAGDFLTSPKAMNSLLVDAPKGWEKKNLEIVLHTTVINGSPGQPDIVATYYW